MVTKNEIKFIKSLTSKRVRNKLKLFVVEGKKSINEFLKSDYKVYKIYSINPSTFNIPEKVVEISMNASEKKMFNQSVASVRGLLKACSKIDKRLVFKK